MEKTSGLNLNIEKEVELLTEREIKVLRSLVAGKTNREIAKELNVSVHTVKAHVCAILRKMDVSDRVQAAVMAVRKGLA